MSLLQAQQLMTSKIGHAQNI